MRQAMNPLRIRDKAWKTGNEEMHLNTLKKGTPGITAVFGQCLAEAAAVCLEDQGHSAGGPAGEFADKGQGVRKNGR